jgi:hypothetical protein
LRSRLRHAFWLRSRRAPRVGGLISEDPYPDRRAQGRNVPTSRGDDAGVDRPPS